MEEKTPLSHEVVRFQMLYFGTLNSNSEISESNSIFKWKISSFSKTTLLQSIELYVQRESFLTLFYTINSSSPCLLLGKFLC